MALYILPCSGEDSRNRFEHSVVSGIDKDLVFSNVSSDVKNKLELFHDKIGAWGCALSSHNLYDSMEDNDILLFIQYNHKTWEIVTIASVIAKEENEELSKKIWTDVSKNWPYIFYFNNIEKVAIPITNEDLGYRSGWNGDRAVRFDKSPKKRKVYDSLKGIINNYNDDPFAFDSDKLFEGARKTEIVNKYERNREAREICLKQKGRICTICGLNFGKTYGNYCEGYIHVHHIIPISDINEEYIINPVEDLVPLCPNCHAAIHKYMETNTVEDPFKALEKMKDMMKNWKNCVELFQSEN